MTSTTPLGKQKRSLLINSFDVAVLAVDFAFVYICTISATVYLESYITF